MCHLSHSSVCFVTCLSTMKHLAFLIVPCDIFLRFREDLNQAAAPACVQIFPTHYFVPLFPLCWIRFRSCLTSQEINTAQWKCNMMYVAVPQWDMLYISCICCLRNMDLGTVRKLLQWGKDPFQSHEYFFAPIHATLLNHNIFFSTLWHDPWEQLLTYHT